jgi:hypothetical protein
LARLDGDTAPPVRSLISMQVVDGDSLWEK